MINLEVKWAEEYDFDSNFSKKRHLDLIKVKLKVRCIILRLSKDYYQILNRPVQIEQLTVTVMFSSYYLKKSGIRPETFFFG
jgi:hypothetical protein